MKTLNIISAIIFLACCALAWLVWTGTVKVLDGAFGIARNDMSWTWQVTVYFLLVGVFEVVVYKIIKRI